MRRAFAICSVLILTAVVGSYLAKADQQGEHGSTAALCKVAKGVTPLAGLSEASGLTLSRTTAGLLWSHNDSGEPMLSAVDLGGSVKGRVQVPNARVEDWEDVSAGPCARGSCLYIADIGDNNRVRRRITVYRVPEPRADEGTSQQAEAIEAVYPDGAHDAEALFVTSADDLFIVTKAGADQTAVYRFPKPLRAGTPSSLQLVSRLPIARVTDADASPDGAWVAIRTKETVLFYRTRDLTAGKTTEPLRFDLVSLREPQGEGVTIAADGAVYLAGEGGGGGGTLAALRCALP